MKIIKLLLIVVNLQFLVSYAYACQARALFSPNGGVQNEIINEIRSAKKTVSMAAYTLTAPKIVLELEASYLRGVIVKVLTDKNQSNMPFNFPSKVEKKHSIMHNKIIIIDDMTVITGSYNFTQAAEYKNAENILIIKECPNISRAYKEEFTRLWQ